MQRVIPPHLLEKLNELGRLALNFEELRARGDSLAKEIITIGRAESFTDAQIKDMLKQAILNVGLSVRTYYYALPDDLKDKDRQNRGRNGGGHNRRQLPPPADNESTETGADQSQPEEPTPTPAANPAPVVAEKQRSPDSVAADKAFEKEILDENFKLQARIKELEQQVAKATAPDVADKSGKFKVKIPLKLFGKVFASLKMNSKFVLLDVDASTLEVLGAESVK